jgi:acyl-CoA synthetase (AMP-forming)/AMP-acid ligase II
MVVPPERWPTLLHYLERGARLFPSREAAWDGRESLDYAGLAQCVEACAVALGAAGLRPGNRVAYLGTPGVQFWASLLAVQRAGGIWLGLNPLQTERELAHVLGDARPVLTFIGPGLSAASREALQRAATHAGVDSPRELPVGVDGLRHGLEALGRLEGGHDDAVASGLAARGASLIVYTSGSSGRPKGALITHAGLVENGWWLARRLGFEPCRTLANLPINHIGCVGDVCATTLVAGGTLVFMDRFDAGQAVALLRGQRITWLAQVPAQFQLMVARGGLQAEDLVEIRHLTWGGAPMPRGLIEQFMGWVPDLFNSYGLTECSGTITVSPRGASLDTLAETVGRPVDPGLLRIADGEKTLPAGQAGEVQIRGHHLFGGYLNQPQATAEAFTADGWLRTRDLGLCDDTGNVRLLGRMHDMFKSGGFNVYPREVEGVIESMAGVELCAVLAVPDPLWGEVGIAFVQSNSVAVTAAALEQHCARLLARYKIPKRFELRPSLPLLAVGKIDKQALRAQEMAVPDHDTRRGD